MGKTYFQAPYKEAARFLVEISNSPNQAFLTIDLIGFLK